MRVKCILTWCLDDGSGYGVQRTSEGELGLSGVMDFVLEREGLV